MRHRGRPRRPPMRGPRPGMRPVRRGMNRPARTPLPPHPDLVAAREDVARAHKLMAAGEFDAACDLFSRVAALAAGHQHFRRAGQLYAQAAHAAIEGGELALATSHADRAIATLIQGGDFPHAVRVVNRIKSELRAHGHEAEAESLRAKLEARLDELGLALPDFQASATPPTPRRELPAECHACLGPVRSDEVEWIDDNSATCAYCGSTLKAV